MNEPPDRRTDQSLRKIIDTLGDHPFGIITQRGYDELRKQIEATADKNNARFHRWLVMGLIAFAMMAMGTTVALVGYGVLLTKQGNVTSTIQKQRYDSLLDACLNQNKRHDDVIIKIDEAVAAVPPPRAQQRKAREDAKPFKLILEAAVPYTDDCRAYARRRVKGDAP